LIINGTEIEDTFAEAFGMTATRVVITAIDARWARIAAETMTGFATSVIGCGVEAGIGEDIPPQDSPDGRPAVSVLIFGMSGDSLAKHLQNLVGQCVLTCPTCRAKNAYRWARTCASSATAIRCPSRSPVAATGGFR
jgi:formylmethanofuran--tetrahydromethanopterin N-formyltransferase